MTYKPKKWSELAYKDKLSYITCLTSFILGWILVFISLFLPPVGEISGSSISIFGMALSYSAAVLSISLFVKNSMSEIRGQISDEVRKQINSSRNANDEEPDNREDC